MIKTENLDLKNNFLDIENRINFIYYIVMECFGKKIDDFDKEYSIFLKKYEQIMCDKDNYDLVKYYEEIQNDLCFLYRLFSFFPGFNDKKNWEKYRNSITITEKHFDFANKKITYLFDFCSNIFPKKKNNNSSENKKANCHDENKEDPGIFFDIEKEKVSRCDHKEFSGISGSSSISKLKKELLNIFENDIYHNENEKKYNENLKVSTKKKNFEECTKKKEMQKNISINVPVEKMEKSNAPSIENLKKNEMSSEKIINNNENNLEECIKKKEMQKNISINVPVEKQDLKEKMEKSDTPFIENLKKNEISSDKIIKNNEKNFFTFFLIKKTGIKNKKSLYNYWYLNISKQDSVKNLPIEKLNNMTVIFSCEYSCVSSKMPEIITDFLKNNIKYNTFGYFITTKYKEKHFVDKLRKLFSVFFDK